MTDDELQKAGIEELRRELSAALAEAASIDSDCASLAVPFFKIVLTILVLHP